jgi:hypothetical protein
MPCRVIAFRNDSGSGLIGNETRGRIWVSLAGLVLCQEITVFRSHVRFYRLSEEYSGDLAESLGPDWMEPIAGSKARRLLESLHTDPP